MEILRETADWVLCVKPTGVLSTDEPGGMPSLVREATGASEIRTVHRLDRVVGGLMVLAKSKASASQLGRQIMDGTFEKQYLAVVHGVLPQAEGRLIDLLIRNKAERKTYVASAPGKDVQEAVLDYVRLAVSGDCSLVSVTLVTGRTHQIRAQFSSRGFPLIGDRKYSTVEDPCGIALWSWRLVFTDPATGERIDCSLPPPRETPWDLFEIEERTASR
jgi:23S rRNA pseudouridine1911/1915/1917 synthase